MALKETIRNDMKTSMKEGNQQRVDVLRMVISEVRRGEIDEKKEFSEDDVIKVIKRGIKSREESIEMYRKGARPDLVEKETGEVAILKTYLPKQLSIEDIERIVEQTIQEQGASSAKDLGIVMRKVMEKYGSQVDGKTVQEVVRLKLK